MKSLLVSLLIRWLEYCGDVYAIGVIPDDWDALDIDPHD